MPSMYVHKDCPDGDDRNIFRYYIDVGRTKILNPKIEKKLFQRYKKHGDIKARDQLLESCLRFVVTLARRHRCDNDTFKDLVSAGNLGLMQALDHYDPNRGTRFLSYATHWILMSMRNELYKRPLVTMPLWRQKAIRKIKIAEGYIAAQHGHVSSEDLAAEVDLTKEQIKRLRGGKGYWYMRVDEQLQGDRPNANTCIVPSKDDLRETSIHKDTSNLIRELLHTLEGKERFIIKNYFGIGIDKRSLRQIADILGITPERVRQIKLISLKRLRRSARHSKKLSTTAEVVV